MNDGDDDYDVLIIIIIILKDKTTCSALIITALTAESHMLYVMCIWSYADEIWAMSVISVIYYLLLLSDNVRLAVWLYCQINDNQILLLIKCSELKTLFHAIVMKVTPTYI